MQTHTNNRPRTKVSGADSRRAAIAPWGKAGSSAPGRRNRVYKSLHKPLTYLGVERTVFFFVCVAAVGTFNLFNSLIAGIAVFIGGYAFGHWVTNTDPAFLRILAKSGQYKIRYDAAKTTIPRVEVR